MDKPVKVIITYKSGRTHRVIMKMSQFLENHDNIPEDSSIEKIEIDRKRK